MSACVPQRRLGRLVATRAALVMTAGTCLLALLWSYQVIEDRVHARTDAQGQAAAEMVAGLLAHRHLVADELASGRLGDDAVRRLQQDIAELRSAGELLAVRAWRPDGELLFLDVDRPVSSLRASAADLRRATSGEPWTRHGEDAQGRVVLQAFVPFGGDGGSGEPVTLMHLVLPHDADLAAVQGEIARQQAIVTAVLTVLGGSLVWLRRRLLRREREARQDELTGLLNRRALLEDGRDMARRASTARPLALLLIDLDDFKVVNDTLGHAAGDVLLQRVATVLADSVRPQDIVVRLGGDEFAILVPDLPSADAAQERAVQVLRQLRTASFVVDDVELVVDATIGMSLAPHDGTTVDELLRRADIAMYQAKRRRGGVHRYDNAADNHSVDQLETVTEFRRALENDELVLHHQPKLDLSTGQVCSVEALVRWQHPTRGLLGPGCFLPLVEGTGLMAPLTRWVLRTAVQQAAQWIRAGTPLQVAVNISPETLMERDFPARVRSILAEAGVPARFLQLEITETAVMIDPRRAAVTLRQLREGGVEVLVDDFGAGYTSLAHLRTLPIAGFKLDRSLITRMLEDPQALAVTEALIDLGHRLQLRVVAEGVETDVLLERLALLNCDEAQGYGISRPAPAEVLEQWLAEAPSREGAFSRPPRRAAPGVLLPAVPEPRRPGQRHSPASCTVTTRP